jgi:hypothetical protein
MTLEAATVPRLTREGRKRKRPPLASCWSPPGARRATWGGKYRSGEAAGVGGRARVPLLGTAPSVLGFASAASPNTRFAREGRKQDDGLHPLILGSGFSVGSTPRGLKPIQIAFWLVPDD